MNKPIFSKYQLIKFCTIGTLLEWYDFAIFGVLSPILAQLFFPSENKTTGLIYTFGVFASGFIMRPIGALFLGHIGDKYGRKFALCLNMIAVTIATAAIGLLPTYAQIGIYAPILLVFFRLLQGFFVGAEYSGVITYLAEMSEKKNLCLLASFSVFGVVGGILLGSLVGSISTGLLPANFLLNLGWRLPFLFSIFLGIVGYQIRKQLNESSAFLQLQTACELDRFPITSVFKQYKLPVVAVTAFYWTATVATYLSFMYVPAKLASQSNAKIGLILLLNSIGLMILTIFIPIFAHLADKIGKIKLLKIGAWAYLLLSYPAFCTFNYHNPWLAFVGQIIFALLQALFVASLPAMAAVMFPTKVRCSGVSIGLNVAATVFGGTAPLVATWLVAHTNNLNSPVFYLLISVVITILFTTQLHKMKLYSINSP